MIRALLLSVVCVTLSFAQDTTKPIDPAKKTAIQHLLSAMRATELMNQQIKAMAPAIINMLKSNPNITTEFADEFGKRFVSETSTESISEIVSQAYADHFTMQEIKDLITFYDSPTGKKLAEVQPKIMTDVSQKAQEYGQKLGMKIAQDIAKEHPEYIKNGGAGAPPQ